MKKYIIRILLLICIVVSIYYCDILLSIKTTHGIKQAKYMYDQPKNTIDVVMLGSSHIHCDINTALLWEDYGIASYDYSAAEQPMWITYYYLKEICKTQQPKVAVIDLFGPARFKENYQYDWLADNLQGVRFSYNKLMMMKDSIEIDKLSNYFPSFFQYHNRYNQLTDEDINELSISKKERASFKGYTPYFEQEAQTEPEIVPVGSGGITPKSEIYLLKIIEYCNEHNIKLFFIVTPYITNDEDELVYNRIKEIAEDEGVEFNSTNYDYSEMGLDFSTDFNDPSHLNYTGSCKFTKYLADELLQRYDLPDHRGDIRYQSWEDHCESIKELVNANS